MLYSYCMPFQSSLSLYQCTLLPICTVATIQLLCVTRSLFPSSIFNYISKIHFLKSSLFPSLLNAFCLFFCKTDCTLLWSILKNSTFRLRAIVGGALTARAETDTHITLLPICYFMINRIDIEHIVLSYETQHCDTPRAPNYVYTLCISSFLTFYSPTLLLSDRNISCSAKAIYVNGSFLFLGQSLLYECGTVLYVAHTVPCYVLAVCVSWIWRYI